MEERSLRITGADTGFFNKLTKTLTRMLIPTKIGINGMVITMKRNAMLKTYEAFSKENEDYNNDELEKKFDTAYTVYLEALDKHIMDSIYKKVKNGTASDFEKEALSKYYEVTSLKEKDFIDYKYRKQKYLIDLDWQGINANSKEKVKQKYISFYIYKMDSLYKSILKNYSIKLADTTNAYDSTKEWIYTKIFYTLEEYIQNILSLKVENFEDEFEGIKEEYERFQGFTVGKLDTKDNIEKNMILLGISRKLFTHSIPLIVAEQCYEKLLKDARILVQDTKMAVKRENAYNMLINLIEDYNIKLLSTKVYWENMKERENYKKFWDKYKEISKLKDVDFVEYMRQKEVLFIKDDMKKIQNTKFDYSKIIVYYKRKLVDYGAIRELKNTCKTAEKYIGTIKQKENRVSA